MWQEVADTEMAGREREQGAAQKVGWSHQGPYLGPATNKISVSDPQPFHFILPDPALWKPAENHRKIANYKNFIIFLL